MDHWWLMTNRLGGIMRKRTMAFSTHPCRCEHLLTRQMWVLMDQKVGGWSGKNRQGDCDDNNTVVPQAHAFF
jgi:hypothetical protein